MSGGPIPKIRMRGVKKAFGSKVVLDGVDLDVAAGQGLVILGGSGSGKSVTIKCILGLIEPDEGVIEVDGVNVLKLPRREREALGDRIGMLFQNGALFDSLPVWENVCFKLLAQNRIAAAGRATRRPRCWRRSAWRLPSAISRRPSCRAACRSGWRWPAPSPRSPTSSSSMNQPPGSTRSWRGDRRADRRLRAPAGRDRGQHRP